MEKKIIHVLDYGAGNVRSLKNAIRAVGFEPVDVKSPDELKTIKSLIFPGVGAFGSAMEYLKANGYVEPLRDYLKNENNYYLGICIGLQTLFASSSENPNVEGLNIIPTPIEKFSTKEKNVPLIGWNGLTIIQEDSPLFEDFEDSDRMYFVHSFRAEETEANKQWTCAKAVYGSEEYVAAVQKGRVMAVQFHPEKSGKTGLNLLRNFLTVSTGGGGEEKKNKRRKKERKENNVILSKRVVACLDVRSNDEGK